MNAGCPPHADFEMWDKMQPARFRPKHLTTARDNSEPCALSSGKLADYFPNSAIIEIRDHNGIGTRKARLIAAGLFLPPRRASMFSNSYGQ